MQRHDEPLLWGHGRNSSNVPNSFSSDLFLSRQLTNYTWTSSYNSKINSKITAWSQHNLHINHTHQRKLHLSQGLPRNSTQPQHKLKVSVCYVAIQIYWVTTGIFAHLMETQNKNNFVPSFHVLPDLKTTSCFPHDPPCPVLRVVTSPENKILPVKNHTVGTEEGRKQWKG